MKYTAKITQDQFVGQFKINPKGGDISEKDLTTFKKDAYGTSLIEKGLFIVDEQKQYAASAVNTPNIKDESINIKRK